MKYQIINDTHSLMFKNYLMVYVYYVPGMGISTLHSSHHLIFKVGTITPILYMKKLQVEELSQVVFVSWKMTEHGFECRSP